VTSPEAGLWYSTTRAGYGTTWKVAQVVKRIAKSCSDDSINAAVERAAACVQVPPPPVASRCCCRPHLETDLAARLLAYRLPPACSAAAV
jgi:hypothetical protein